jgi:hypothetical protein
MYSAFFPPHLSFAQPERNAEYKARPKPGCGGIREHDENTVSNLMEAYWRIQLRGEAKLSF